MTIYTKDTMRTITIGSLITAGLSLVITFITLITTHT